MEENNKPAEPIDQYAEFSNVRLLIHDLINQITKFDGLSRKLKKGIVLGDEQVEIFSESVDQAKKVVSELRENIHFMQQNCKKNDE